jgi:diguanylate cyclase (GGDEF)-like protein/PAS domain S-box-containing protein
MPIETKTLRLLILEDSQNEAERLVSLFRNAGKATHACRLTCREELDEALKQTWDLLICAPSSKALPAHEALAEVRRQGKDIPAIQLLASNDTAELVQALNLGAQSALCQNDDELLILIAQRELNNLNERRGRRSAESALREVEKRCQLLLESSVDAIAYVHDGMHVYANRAYLNLFGFNSSEELEGLPMIDLISAGDQSAFKDFLKKPQNLADGELSCSGVRVDNRVFSSRIKLSPATFDGEPCIQAVIRDASDTTELQEKLREASRLDPVTNLHNRTYFMELLNSAVHQAVNTEQVASLAYIRIDHYTSLLADVGLVATDLLLSALADLLRGHFPEDAHVARLSDDVFAVLQSNISPQQQRPLLESLLKRVEEHFFDTAGRTIQTTLSIGVAGLNETTAKAEEVIGRAQQCVDSLEQPNGIKVYDPSEELAEAANRGNLVAMLQHALVNNSFRLLFQPIISLRGDQHEHYEVLLRLLRPNGSEVPPEAFLHLDKESGLVERIDRWVILKSIKLLSEQLAKGHPTRLFVHLSAASLQDASLLPWLKVALKSSRLPEQALIFQFSEPNATTYLKQAVTLAQGLKALHCNLSLTQFGCALNPFNTLRHIPADFVKVDKSFTQELTHSDKQETLKTLLGTLHSQGKQSIVPFVENAGTLSTLWQVGADYIQGYYLQQPSQSMNYDFSSDS